MLVKIFGLLKTINVLNILRFKKSYQQVINMILTRYEQKK